MSKLIQLNMPLYEKFPRVLAKFINRHLKVKYACIMFQNDAAAPVLPDVFIPTLELFNQIFISVQPASLTKSQEKQLVQ